MTTDEKNSANLLEQFIRWSPWVMFVVAAFVLATYVIAFSSHPFASDPSAFGQFGDYFAGILNPVVAFCALLALVWSVTIQREELRRTNDALASQEKLSDRQLKLRTFFDLLSVRDQQLAALAVDRWNEQLLLHAAPHLRNDVQHLDGSAAVRAIATRLDLATACNGSSFSEAIDFAEGFVDNEAQALRESCGPWARTTEAILDFVDSQLVSPDAEMCARVLRNLHSTAELHVLLWLWWPDPASRYLLLAERQSLFGNVKTNALSAQIALRAADPL